MWGCRNVVLVIVLHLVAGLGLLPAGAAVVAHYPFDADFQDSTANDLDLTNHGSSGGAVAITSGGGGRFGEAAEFDGADDFLSQPSESFNFGTTDFALSFWYRSDTTEEDFFSLVGKTDSAADEGYAARLNFGDLDGILLDDTGNRVLTPRPQGDISQYQHVVFQRNGDEIELYLNGASVDTDTGNDALDVDTTYRFGIGARNIQADGSLGDPLFGYFDGRIDEVWVLDEALTPGEIENLRSSNVVPEPSSLILALSSLTLLLRWRRDRTRR
jgi:hypothetical protein